MSRAIVLSALLALGSSVALAAPSALSGVEGGLWEVSRSATGAGGTRQCVADAKVLAQWEHRGINCQRTLQAERNGELVINYSCPGGDFAQVKMKAITPRTLRIETQGIHSGEPFFYNLHARRVGNC